MKTALIYCVALLSLVKTTTAQIIENLQTYTPAEFTKYVCGQPMGGFMLRLKFNYRGFELTDAEEKGCREGTVFVRGSADSVTVIVPPEGVSWFARVPCSIDAGAFNVKSFLAYGKVEVDAKGRVLLRLVGTEIKHDDLEGDSIIWH
jgi:hypothetical protein